MPVRTVPYPLIGKQWSTANRKSFFKCSSPLAGISIQLSIPSKRSSSPWGGPSLGFALTGQTVISEPNFVFENDCLSYSLNFGKSSTISTLFKTIIMSYIIISPKIMHSDVYV